MPRPTLGRLTLLVLGLILAAGCNHAAGRRPTCPSRAGCAPGGRVSCTPDRGVGCDCLGAVAAWGKGSAAPAETGSAELNGPARRPLAIESYQPAPGAPSSGTPDADRRTPSGAGTRTEPRTLPALPTRPAGEVPGPRPAVLPPAARIGFETIEEIRPASPVSPAGPQAALRFGEPALRRRSFVDTTAAACFGHAPDYSWLSGQVEHSAARNEWRLRYAAVDETDRYGGAVRLIQNKHVEYLTDGQYVRVEGHVATPQSPEGKPTYYRIQSFKTIEKANTVPAP